MNRDVQKDFARTLYLTDSTATQKEIAQRTGVSEQTLSKWVNADGWDKLRRSKLASRQNALSNAYDQLENLNRVIMAREEDQRFANAKEADTIVKLSAAIRQLETQLSVADVMDIGMHFVQHVRQVAPEKTQDVLDLYDSFIKATLKR